VIIPVLDSYLICDHRVVSSNWRASLWGEVATSGLGFPLVGLDLESAYTGHELPADDSAKPAGSLELFERVAIL
jgi:hypothetical protein